jgi:glycosyltransferase involved in cell wall biosynthesis
MESDVECDSRARALRTAWGVESDEKVILFAGKLQEKKCPDILISAFAKLKNTRAALVFVGDGEEKSNLRQAALKAAGKVVFVPFCNQSEMPAVYRAGDVFVLPSTHDETWGLATNEAMCSGIPVILSDRVGCSPDLVVPGVTGWVFSSGNAERLTEVLQAALNSADLPAMGRSARVFISDWSIKRKADGVIAACLASREASL